MSDAPALVTLHLWGVPLSRTPHAVLRMALDRRRVRDTPGVRFGKLLGTGRGRSFTPRDTDLRRWGLIVAWESGRDADAFESGPTARAWGRISCERLRVRMRPLASRGQWSRRQPFGDPDPLAYDGPVAAVTRARLAPGKTLTFWRSVPAVSADLRRCPGLRLAVGIGEAPIGLQGTFSLWDSPRDLTEFAHRRAPHRAAIARTAEVGWYREELFARFAVLSVDGTFGGRAP